MKSCQKSIIWLLIQSLEVGSYANVDRNYLGIKLAAFSSVLIDPQSESCIFIYKIHSQKEKAVLRISRLFGMWNERSFKYDTFDAICKNKKASHVQNWSNIWSRCSSNSKIFNSFPLLQLWLQMERFETKILVFFSKSEELRVANISETRRKSNISAETRSWVKQIIKKQINSLFEYIGSFTYSSKLFLLSSFEQFYPVGGGGGRGGRICRSS